MSADTITTPSGTLVSWDGPSSASVTRALVKGGHAKSATGRNSRTAPTPGFIAIKPRGVAYVEVFSTMRGNDHGYASTLEAAGFIVEQSTHSPGVLVVFKAPTV